MKKWEHFYTFPGDTKLGRRVNMQDKIVHSTHAD